MIPRFLVLFALMVTARPLAAQEPTPGQMRAAEHLVTVMRLESSWAPLTEQIVRQGHGEGADTSRFAAESAARLREMFATNLRWEAIRPEYVRLYASLYTEDELRQLAAFYESPVGQKSLRLAPEVSARLFAVVQRLMVSAPPR